MNPSVIVSFKYKSKTFVYYIEDSNLLYGYYSDDFRAINKVDDIAEINMMDSLSKNIFISNDSSNHIKIGTTKYKNKLFQIMYDSISRLKFFYEIKENKYFIPDKKDLSCLMMMFNDTSYYMFDDKSRSSDEESVGVLKRTLRYNGEGIIVEYEDPEVYLCSLKGSSKLNESEEKSVIDSSIFTNIVIEALNNNPFLKEKERTFISELIPLLVKYRRYINIDTLVSSIEIASVRYYNHENLDGYGGLCGDLLKDITIFNSTCFEDCPLAILSHERGHVISPVSGSLGLGMYEAINEIISSEYEYSDGCLSYLTGCSTLKTLFELVGEEPFAAYYFSGDIKYVFKALESIIPDKNLVFGLISNLDNILIYQKRLKKYNKDVKENNQDNSTLNEIRDNIESSRLGIQETLSKYFLSSKGYPIEEDSIIMTYLYQDKDLNWPIWNFDISYEENGIISYTNGCQRGSKKGWFVDEYIEKYKDLVVPIQIGRDNDETYNLVIDNNNRRIESRENVVGFVRVTKEQKKL